LPPTIKAKADCVISWVEKLMRLCPITAISVETVRFDTQKLQNSEISGTEYQQGTLFGYEIREYLLAKFGHKCQYCQDKSKDPVLEIDHIIPESRGGSNRVSNLTLACHTCNQDKDIELLHPIEDGDSASCAEPVQQGTIQPGFPVNL
jgi:5-methylcytosine-specific restriction endonuclease McrA